MNGRRRHGEISNMQIRRCQKRLLWRWNGGTFYFDARKFSAHLTTRTAGHQHHARQNNRTHWLFPGFLNIETLFHMSRLLDGFESIRKTAAFRTLWRIIERKKCRRGNILQFEGIRIIILTPQ
ncbi:hypothetical protein PCH70_30010 [Pseudomonas cichorii JBC1]|nr:hypothetical protein PCH70_30010 [Pseudomonas cichorii JBC1]